MSHNERIVLWVVQCLLAVRANPPEDAAEADAAEKRILATLDTIKEAQVLVAQSIEKAKDLRGQVKVTNEIIDRLEGRSKPEPQAPEPRTLPGESAAIVLVEGDAGPCAECGATAGAGLVGWRNSDEPGPLCIHCLAHSSPDLGALKDAFNHLRLVSREAGLDESDTAGTRLLELARRYAKANAGGWPLRPTKLLENTIEDHQQLVETYGMDYLEEIERRGTGAQEPN